jgi:hypothetical protein
MSVNLLVFLLGLFGIPLFLLWFGHRLRRRTPRERSVFWGALIGHCVAGTVAVVWGMIPPETWTAEERARGFVGLWSLLLVPLVGAAIGAMSPRGQVADAPPLPPRRRASDD